MVLPVSILTIQACYRSRSTAECNEGTNSVLEAKEERHQEDLNSLTFANERAIADLEAANQAAKELNAQVVITLSCSQVLTSSSEFRS